MLAIARLKYRILGLFPKTCFLFCKSDNARVFLNTPKVFLNTPKVFLNTPKVFLNTPKVFLNTPKVFFNKAGLLQNKVRLLQNKAGLLQNKVRFYVVFRQKSEFAATVLPPKNRLNTGVSEDWWQGGSKN